jgi:hypothetical protein
MSIPLKPDDPTMCLLRDNVVSIPKIFRKGCYICEDPEFALMGLPLCRVCELCGGHIPADDSYCDDCLRHEEDFHKIDKCGWCGRKMYSGYCTDCQTKGKKMIKIYKQGGTVVKVTVIDETIERGEKEKFKSFAKRFFDLCEQKFHVEDLPEETK